MITNETRTILKSLLSVNNEMIIEPTMHGADEFKSIMFRANLNRLEDDFEEFGIYDTASFLNALELLDNPEITLEDNGSMIKAKDSNSEMKFVTSPPSSLDSVQINPRVIDSTLKIDTILEFSFDTELINTIKKTAGVFKTFDTAFLINSEEGTFLKLGAKDSFSRSNNSFSVKVDTVINTEKEFELAIPLEGFLKFPAMEYDFKVKHNEEKDAYRVILENELLIFLLSLKR